MRLTVFFVNWFQRWMPDSFVVAVVLSGITFVSALVFVDYSFEDTLLAWGDGFWGLLTFTNQVVLTLIFGHALAHTPTVNAALRRFAQYATTPTGAYMLVCFVSGFCALFSWGLCLIAGAVMARITGQVCRERDIQIHYPLLVALAFSGFVIWHQGLSSSIGLAIATPGHFLEAQAGIVPMSETIFTVGNVMTALVILFTLPLIMARLHNTVPEKRPAPAVESRNQVPDTDASVQPSGTPSSPAMRLEQSRLPNILVVVVGLAFLGLVFVGEGRGLNLNLLNFAFLILGLMLTRSLVHFAGLITNAARAAGPWLLQYPFYAGIAGMMEHSGLAELVVQGFVAVSNSETLELWLFLSAAILNFFIPSGGGQWAVQGPIAVSAANTVGVDLPDVAMAVAMGDQWTNLIHPLVTIPAVTIAGIHVRDMLGFCMMALLYTGLIFVAAIVFL